VALTGLTPGWLPGLPTTTLDPIVPADYRYTTVRHHATNPLVVVVCRLDQPIASVHVNVARWLRSQWLHRTALYHPGLPVHEGDVVIHILQALLRATSPSSHLFDPTAFLRSCPLP
jgi:hypothetical protein